MSLKYYKPTTSARRHTSVVSSSDLTKGKRREKGLCQSLNKHSGRNNQGQITVRHRGGGTKKIYRQVDFKQQKFDMAAKVEAIEYDPNRNARIALISYADGEKSYILAAEGVQVGDLILSSKNKIEIKVGNRMPLEFVPQGEAVYNIELEAGKGGKLARGAGTYAVLQNMEGEYAQLKTPSGEIRLVRKGCAASLGKVSNPEYKLMRIGKAGRKRRMGWRPTVRGKAMNPVDHPHGGGEGRHPIGMKYPKTLWGKHALGVKTRRKRWTDKLILQRRKK